jgi:hypothetical protein
MHIIPPVNRRGLRLMNCLNFVFLPRLQLARRNGRAVQLACVAFTTANATGTVSSGACGIPLELVARAKHAADRGRRPLLPRRQGQARRIRREFPGIRASRSA